MKMDRLILSLLLWTVLTVSSSLHAENAYNTTFAGYKDIVVEPSPEMAALNRHIDCPVSYATGSYTLSIPLFSWDECGYPISLSLDYSPGIKADDKAGIFGLGWSLGGISGTISRQVIGLPDNISGAIIGDTDPSLKLSYLPLETLKGFASGNKDSYADKFYYSVNGYSGCFIIRNEKAEDLSSNDIKISVTKDAANQPKDFTITTPEGWKYYLTPGGTSSRETKMYVTSNTYVHTNYSAPSLWAANRIELPDGASTLTLDYSSGSYEKNNKQDLYSFTVDQDGHTVLSEKGITNKVITRFSGFSGFHRIKGSQAEVVFNFDNDLMTGKVTDSQGKVVRTFELEFDKADFNRRKLLSLSVFSDGELLDRRVFTYHKDSYYKERPDACIDFFGYSNRNYPVYTRKGNDLVDMDKGNGDGKKTEWDYVYTGPDTNTIGPINEPVSESVLNKDGTPNPHREYVFEHACSASLKEITDANGLTTSITYEPNVAPLIRWGDTIPDIGIGIRVAKIETVDEISGIVRTRSFKYFNPDFSIPLANLSKTDFMSHSGTLSASGFQNYSQTTTFTSSCRQPGMSAESATILYGAVEETVTGSDMLQPIKTRYEFDNSMSINSSFSIEPRIDDDHRTQNPSAYLGYGIPYSAMSGNNDVRSGFMELFYQKSPLKRKIVYEGVPGGGYRVKEETINHYTHCSLGEVSTGIFCERLKREVFDGRAHYVEDVKDFNIGVVCVERGRTTLDSTIVIKYFPDGARRRIETRYLYPDRDLTSVREIFSDQECDIQGGNLHRPIGTVVKCTGTTIAKYDLLSEHLQAHGTAGSSIRTLPVLSRTIVNNNKEFTSRTIYRKFDSNLLPCRYETLGKDGEPVIDWLEVDSYNFRRQPLKVRRHAAPTMVYTYQDDGQALKSISIDGTPLVKTYTHQPLVGYTSATTPAGNTTHYDYSGGRLSRIRDRDGNPVKKYDYHLFSPEDYIHGYIRETTFLKAAGKDSMSAVQLFDCYGELYATIAEGASAPGVGIVSFSRLDALGRPVKQYLPFPFTASDDLSYQDLALNGQDMAVSFYSDQAPYTLTEYIPGSASDTPAITIDAGSDHDGWKTTVAEKCNNTTDASLRCLRLSMTGVNALRCQGYWPAGALDVTEVTDADGARVLEFSDFRGLKLLSRRMTGDGTRLDTYYVYDEWGNLRMAIPPEAAASLPAATQILNAVTDASLPDYAYHYIYDEANRLISKKLPGAEKIT
ncbi:MAG: hypothetical protein K2H98_09340, partial [Duncaniella sp.]|nr:hypothetical protein [Duncaniella sp.]